jgi:hypothetical protein
VLRIRDKHPGSKGKKGTGSRFRIRNIGLEYVQELSRLRSRIRTYGSLSTWMLDMIWICGLKSHSIFDLVKLFFLSQERNNIYIEKIKYMINKKYKDHCTVFSFINCILFILSPDLNKLFFKTQDLNMDLQHWFVWIDVGLHENR